MAQRPFLDRAISNRSGIGEGFVAFSARARDALLRPGVGRALLLIGLGVGASWWLWFGARRWFIADDWSYLIYRDVLDQPDFAGVRTALFTPMNGQPVVVSAFEFSLLGSVFGWGSYLPFVLVNVALHMASGVLLWWILVRVGVTEATATAVSVVVLFLGPATEFPTLAAISNYQFSLVAFLAITAILLSGPEADALSNRRLAAGVTIGVVAALASGFTLVFAVGELGVGASARRLRAAVMIVVPQFVLYGLWYLTYGRDAASGSPRPGLGAVPGWVFDVVIRTFDTIGAPAFGGVVLIAALALGLLTLDGPAIRRRIPWVMALTMGATLVAIGTQRAANGVDNGAIGRYIVMMSFLAAPAVAIAIDRTVQFDARLIVVVFGIVVASVAANMVDWRRGQLFMIDASTRDRQALSVIADSDLGPYPRDRVASLCSPDIRIAHIGELVRRHAVTPVAGSESDRRMADQVLNPDAIDGTDARPCAPVAVP